MKELEMRMKDLENEKLEIADELGVCHANDVEVNVKIASQDEAEFSKKTRTKQHNLNFLVRSCFHLVI